MNPAAADRIPQAQELARRLRREIGRALVGQETVVEQVLAAIAAGRLAPNIGREIIEAINALGNLRAVEDFERRLVIVEGKVVN